MIRRLPFLISIIIAGFSIWQYWTERYTPAIFFILLAIYIGST